MDGRTLHNELVRHQRNLSRSMAEYVQATRRMIYMVKAVDLTLESLYSGHALVRAIWRYEALWLPILAALSDPPTGPNKRSRRPTWRQTSFATKVEDIRSKNFSKGGLWLNRFTVVPPIDIAWVWHCHRLNPDAYEQDLTRFVNENDNESIEYMRHACSTTIDTAFVFSDGEDAQSKKTRRLWDIVYPFESFMPKYLISHTYAVEESKKRQNITSYANEITRESFRSVLTYDLLTACGLQKSFLYQMVDETDVEKMEVYETNTYLQRAYQRYLMYILLHQEYPNTFLVPMYDINIIWHMHLSCTTEYQDDCIVIIGRIIKHSPINVENQRIKAIEEMEAEQAENGDDVVDPSIEEEEGFKLLQEKRKRGIAIRDTKEIWEKFYGPIPRYDSPGTLYRGLPTGPRAGFYKIFEKINGTANDITWPETILRMMLAIFFFFAGVAFLFWAFYKTMFTHGKFLLGLPVGLGIMAFGVMIFFSIPTSRPLSSQSRYWQDCMKRQNHNPLPPYLSSTNKKTV